MIIEILFSGIKNITKLYKSKEVEYSDFEEMPVTEKNTVKKYLRMLWGNLKKKEVLII